MSLGRSETTGSPLTTQRLLQRDVDLRQYVAAMVDPLDREDGLWDNWCPYQECRGEPSLITAADHKLVGGMCRDDLVVLPG